MKLRFKILYIILFTIIVLGTYELYHIVNKPLPTEENQPIIVKNIPKEPNWTNDVYIVNILYQSYGLGKYDMPQCQSRFQLEENINKDLQGKGANYRAEKLCLTTDTLIKFFKDTGTPVVVWITENFDSPHWENGTIKNYDCGLIYKIDSEYIYIYTGSSGNCKIDINSFSIIYESCGIDSTILKKI